MLPFRFYLSNWTQFTILVLQQKALGGSAEGLHQYEPILRLTQRLEWVSRRFPLVVVPLTGAGLNSNNSVKFQGLIKWLSIWQSSHYIKAQYGTVHYF